TFDDVVMVKSDAGSLTAKAAVIESLIATDASAQKFEVKTVGVESLIADSISTEDLIANSADLETLFCPLACIEDLEAGVLSAKDLDVENLVAGHVSAQTVSGVWESWSLANPSSGSVVFPGIASDGSGFIASQEVTVPAGTTALFLQAGATGGDWVCAWGTRRVSETTWDICCRYPKGAYEEMAAGTFVPVEEVRVVWCALSVAP
ncbi:MAG: hypothetical protein HGA54_01285, partial [Actinobacteria bacterium]|nr:hypothetical protein [Actinomycetota bacterium]